MDFKIIKVKDIVDFIKIQTNQSITSEQLKTLTWQILINDVGVVAYKNVQDEKCPDFYKQPYLLKVLPDGKAFIRKGGSEEVDCSKEWQNYYDSLVNGTQK